MRHFIFILFVFTSLCGSAQTVDAQGRKQGYWKKQDDKTNKLLYEGQFKDDKPVGVFKYYYPNDSLRAIMNFGKSGQTAYVKLFHMSGKRMAEGKYVGKEIKDSLWSFYDESGTLISKDRFVQGKKNGLSQVYLRDGKLAEEKSYKNDLLHGPFKEYFDGVNLRTVGNYVNGQLDGRTVYYYPNGVEVAAGYHKKGLKNGPWIYRTESNKVREKELYKNGVLASEKETKEFFQKNPLKESKEKPVTTKKTQGKKSTVPETSHE
jgi:antitoxin component YwqK of YwqJK toxin-antitoxin module